MKRIRESLFDYPVLWLLALGLPVFLVNFFAGKPGISGWDANYYYSYAAALADGGTLDLERAYTEMVKRGADPLIFDPDKRTATGRVYNFYPIGHPLIHTPDTFLGSVVSHLFEEEPGAFGPTAQLFYCLSCIAAAAIGLWLMLRVVSQLFDRQAAALALYVMAACSMLGYYWFILPPLSHTSSLLMSGIILTLFLAAVEKPAKHWGKFFLLGVAIGYNGTVRLQDVGFVWFGAIAAWIAIRSEIPVRSKLGRIVCLGAGGLIGFFPQMLLWKWKDGVWFVAQYSDYAYFSWTDPELFEVLFSLRHGLFSWHPMMLLAAAGFVVYAIKAGKTQAPLTAALALTFLALWYVSASFSIWWFGSSFGSRPFLSVTPLFLVGLSWILQFIRTRRRMRIAFWIVAALAALWNALLAIAFHLAWISRTDALDFGALSMAIFR